MFQLKGVRVVNWHPQFRLWGNVTYDSSVTAPRLLWNDPKEWMVEMFGLLGAHPELVSDIKIVHWIEGSAPEISRDTAEGLVFTKHVIEPRLSAVRGDVQALFRVVQLIARKAGIPQEEIEEACATPPSSDDES